MASMVIYNAKVYLERDRFAQAILIEGDRIRAVGSNEGILAAAPADAERYDAAGRTIVPGFNDSHQHLQMVGELLGSIQLLGACGIGDVQQRVRDFIARTNPAPGTVLHGMGWNQDYFTDESRLLTRADLDAVSTDFPSFWSAPAATFLWRTPPRSSGRASPPTPPRWRAARSTTTRTAS